MAVAAEAGADAKAAADAGAGAEAEAAAEAEAPPPRSPARSSSPDEEEWVAREQAVHLAHMEQAAALQAAAEQAAEQAAVLQAAAERGLAACGASCSHTPGSRPGSRPGSARQSSASQSSALRSGDAVAGGDPEAAVALLDMDMDVELDEAGEGGEGDEADEADEAAEAAARKGGKKKKKPPGACATVCGLLLGNLYLLTLEAMSKTSPIWPVRSGRGWPRLQWRRRHALEEAWGMYWHRERASGEQADRGLSQLVFIIGWWASS